MSTASSIAFDTGLSAADEEAHILRHLPQVRAIARRIHLRLPRQVELADLIGAGTLGLIDAVRRFNPARDAAFATYAQIRIRGAILDSLRSDDWGTRRLRKLARRIDSSRDQLSLRLGRLPALSELAQELGLSPGELEQALVEVRGLQVASFTEPGDETARGTSLDDLPSPDPDPFRALLERENKASVVRAISSLPPRERRLVSLYYGQELTMKEVGERMGISESRVCQMHSAALGRLKRALRGCAARGA